MPGTITQSTQAPSGATLQFTVEWLLPAKAP